MKVGDKIYEIHCVDDKLYINRRIINKISKSGRLLNVFEPHQGLKSSAINQFNRQYRCWDTRGNNLNMFRMYSLEINLSKNIILFRRRFKKLTGYNLPDPILHYTQNNNGIKNNN